MDRNELGMLISGACGTSAPQTPPTEITCPHVTCFSSSSMLPSGKTSTEAETSHWNNISPKESKD
jgi:hypothetical protein